MQNVFKINNKSTRYCSGVFIVTFEYTCHVVLLHVCISVCVCVCVCVCVWVGVWVGVCVCGWVRACVRAGVLCFSRL